MIQLILWSFEDEQAWLNDKQWASDKFQAMYNLRDRSKQALHYHYVNTLAEYWFEFATEEDLVIFKLTHTYDYETQIRRTTSV